MLHLSDVIREINQAHAKTLSGRLCSSMMTPWLHICLCSPHSVFFVCRLLLLLLRLKHVPMHALHQLVFLGNTWQGLFKLLILVNSPPSAMAGCCCCHSWAAAIASQADGQNDQQMAADPQLCQDEPAASLYQGHCRKITLPSR